MRSTHIIGVVALLVAAAGGAYFYVSASDDNSTVDSGDGSNSSEQNDDWRIRIEGMKGAIAAEEAATKEFLSKSKAEDRIEILEWAVKQDWARPDRGLLHQAMVSDQSDDVRVKAIQLAMEKAADDYHDERRNDVVRLGLSSEREKLRQEALRQARIYPSVELVDDLIEIADSEEQWRFLAIDALAFTEDASAKAKVLERARDDSVPKAERVRAIALLHQTKDPNAKSYLEAWASSPDSEISSVAAEALKAYE